MINRSIAQVPSPVLEIREFRIVEDSLRGKVCGRHLQSKRYGVVELQGTATGHGVLILGSPTGPIVVEKSTWKFDWRGTFSVWIATGPDPQIDRVQTYDTDLKPNRITRIAEDRLATDQEVAIEEPDLLAPLIIPLTRTYFGRHPQTLFPVWPMLSTDEEAWGYPLLPPLH